MVNTYKATGPWSSFVNIVEQVSQCAIPTIIYNDKKLSFATATEGANVHYDITCTDVKSGDLLTTMDVSLVQAYQITAYATMDLYTKSDNAVATLYFVNGTLDSPASVQSLQADSRGILVISTDGHLTVSGLNNDESVSVYTTSGAMLGNAKAYAGQADINVSTQDKIVIIKVDGDSIKYAM